MDKNKEPQAVDVKDDPKEEDGFTLAEDRIDITHPEGVDTRIPIGSDGR